MRAIKNKSPKNVYGDERTKTLLLKGAGALIFIFILGLIILYGILTKQYTAAVASVAMNLASTTAALREEMAVHSTLEAQQREILEGKLQGNIHDVRKSLSKETAEVKSDLESQIGNVSSNLQEKISALDVQSGDFSAIIDEIIPAVVSIRTELGSGSGVIYDVKGYILTNKHVIAGAQQIVVVDSDDRRYEGKVLASGQVIDLAVIQIVPDQPLQSLSFAEEKDIKIGMKVIAVGNPLGLSFTVTEGIISATDRVTDNSGVQYLQTDVPINPGNSGGPLINAQKEIVGINTFKLTNSEGLGFAIPAKTAQAIIDFVEEQN